jgi:putative dimethyl sulfoxide reductase chaperone
VEFPSAGPSFRKKIIMPAPSPVSDLWLTLARAFLPPLTQRARAAFRECLPNDLHELYAEAGIDAGGAVADFATAAAGDDDSLLLHYSLLFLTPPVAAHLNVAACLQGTVNGTAMDAIERLLGKYGMGRSECFHDTPDHLSSLLEFMAVLETEDAAEADLRMLADGFLAPAAQRLRADVARVAAASPYLPLLDLLSRALASRLAGHAAARQPERQTYNRDPDKGVWRQCSDCGQPIAREKELAIIARALRDRGLGCEHLARCPDCRDPLRASATVPGRH